MPKLTNSSKSKKSASEPRILVNRSFIVQLLEHVYSHWTIEMAEMYLGVSYETAEELIEESTYSEIDRGE